MTNDNLSGIPTKSKRVFNKTPINIGSTFGRLTVTGKRCVDRRTWYDCICKCGRTAQVQGYNLRGGHVKSCGCWRYENRRILPRKGYQEERWNTIYRGYRLNARQRNLSFDLSLNDFKVITQEDCYYCGKPPSNIAVSECGNGDVVYNGIDRLDSDLGYVPGNMVAACAQCNKSKMNYSLEDFLEMCRRVARRHPA